MTQWLGSTRFIYRVIDWTYSGNKYHPTEKSLTVLTSLIAAFTPANGLVLDPFAGSGSTLLAARSLGFRYLGLSWTRNIMPLLATD